MLDVGTKAPDFRLPDQNGELHSLEQYKMNMQIFGTKKTVDTRKAERYFRERRIKLQSVALK